MRRFVTLFCVVIALDSQSQKKPDSDWRNLFNGKDLAGWKQIYGPARFEAKDRMVIGTTVLGSSSSYLVSEETFGDFIFEGEFKIDEGTNSGIQFRSESKPDYLKGQVFGYQFEIDPSARKWCGGLYDESRRQWIYPLEFNLAAKSAFNNGAWNKVRIEAIGNILRTWVNGIPCAHVVDDLTSSGFIALQVHSISEAKEAGKQVMFRNLRIKTSNLQATLPDEVFVQNFLPNSLTEQEKRNGVKLLWDGKTTEGWRGAYKDKFPAMGWELKNGALMVVESAGAESQNGGDLVTVDKFGAFDFQFEFMLTEGANSGVKYFVTEKEGNKGSAIGLEYQVLDDANHPDAKEGVVGNRTLASLYDLIPSIKVQRGLKKVGEWNQGRIIVYPDNRIEHWLNAYKVVEYQRGTPIFYALVARSKYAQWENFGMAEMGHLLLQDHGDQVSFRSIKIKELK